RRSPKPRIAAGTPLPPRPSRHYCRSGCPAAIFAFGREIAAKQSRTAPSSALVPELPLQPQHVPAPTHVAGHAEPRSRAEAGVERAGQVVARIRVEQVVDVEEQAQVAAGPFEAIR